jgi:hypothetical protein
VFLAHCNVLDIILLTIIIEKLYTVSQAQGYITYLPWRLSSLVKVRKNLSHPKMTEKNMSFVMWVYFIQAYITSKIKQTNLKDKNLIAV